MDTGVSPGSSIDQTPLTAAHVLQSPSLPNLIGNQLQLEMSALLAQAQLSPFFSMPSLYKNNFVAPGCSGWSSGSSDSVGLLLGTSLFGITRRK